MPFKHIDGFIGKVYVPEEVPEKFKKHNCKDCFSCQFCDDSRCEVCIHKKDCDKKISKIIDR